MKKNGGLAIKLLVTGIIAAVIFLGWAFDSVRASEFKVERTYISDTTPVASNRESVDLTFKVTRNGRPCNGHEVEITASAGSWSGGQIGYTDEEGCITFTYVPYNETKYAPADDVDFIVKDLGNSVFIEVNATYTFTVSLQSKGE